MYNSIVVHYGEIGTKGKNRSFFEKKLVENIKWNLKNDYISVKRLYGRIVIDLKENSNKKILKEKLGNIFGITNFSFAVKSSLDLEEIKKIALNLIPEKTSSFRINSSRSNKNFKYSSLEMNNMLGDYIINNKNLKVDLTNPEITIYIEITENNSFIYNEKIKSLGGLPVGVSGKVVSLISGGIDSPVSSYYLMKRGCSVIYVHFYNSTINTKQSMEKVVDIVNVLSKYQFKTKLYLVPFENIQKEIIKEINSRYRMIIYKRFMLMIAEKILENENAQVLVTGDAVASVASQTLENLDAIYKSVKKPVLAPLIGFDKEEIIQIAKKIKTFELSILPYEDCCSFMIAEHPATKSDPEEIKKIESKLSKNILIEKAIKNAIVRKILN
ncbi:tRNA 4-thiouridine(8) synthase ThiI [Candidatus Woesearchaeota archaeon]|nr:tRNA 4-thiouridine(8) synthase ThiI [Candidatus Woesearchaeota archaeon]